MVTILRNPRIAALATYRGEIVGTGTWTPLVSESTWRAVLDDPARGNRTRGVRSLLGGVALCHCGAPAYGSKNSRGQRIYRCRQLPGGGGGHTARLAHQVDDYVTEVVIARLSRDDAVDLLIDPHRPDVDELRGQARALRAHLEELGDEFAAGELPAAQLRRINERIGSQLADRSRDRRRRAGVGAWPPGRGRGRVRGMG